MGRRATSGALVILAVATLGGCGADAGPLEARDDQPDVCATADGADRVVVALNGLTNTGDTPATISLVGLDGSVNLDVVDAEVVLDGASPDGATDADRGDPDVRGPSIAPGAVATLVVTLELYPLRQPESQEGTARGIRIDYAMGVTPAMQRLTLDTQLRVVPAGTACPEG